MDHIAPPAQPIAVAALAAAAGIPVSTRKPDPLPERFVIVSRIGGGSTTFATTNPRFLIECYAPTELAAEDLAEHIRTLWCRLRTHGVIYAYDDDNLTRFDDPNPGRQRFQFTGGLTIRLDTAHRAS